MHDNTHYNFITTSSFQCNTFTTLVTTLHCEHFENWLGMDGSHWALNNHVDVDNCVDNGVQIEKTWLWTNDNVFWCLRSSDFNGRCAGEGFQRNPWRSCQPLTKARHRSVRAHEVFEIRFDPDEPVAAFPTLEKHCMPGTEHGLRKSDSDERQCATHWACAGGFDCGVQRLRSHAWDPSTSPRHRADWDTARWGAIG